MLNPTKHIVTDFGIFQSGITQNFFKQKATRMEEWLLPNSLSPLL
jgi:hypothetical protein